MPPHDLGAPHFSCVLSFFDAIGYRYYLPAYMTYWLDHPDPESTIFEALLWGWSNMSPMDTRKETRSSSDHERLALLDPAQRYVIASFLAHLAHFDREWSTRWDARKALDKGWQTILDSGPPAD